MTVNIANAAAIHFEAGKAACKANHGALADRWQEIGRQQASALNIPTNLRAYEDGLEVGTRLGRNEGRRQGAVLGLGVAFALAVVAGALARGRRGR